LLRSSQEVGGRRHLNWHNIWIAIVNGGTFGIFGGIVGGLLCTFIYRLLHAGQMPHTPAECAFDAVQGPLYWVGLVSGFVIAILTISTFGGAPIWRWRLL
jgi:ABC-type branched-subunit amino acid transport system permease subunit